MRIYLSGPMTSLPDSNVLKFNAVAERLRAEGHLVINPADISHLFGTAEKLEESFRAMYNLPRKGGALQMEYMPHESILAQSVMDANLAAVRSCDAIYMLKGWENSRGAKKELVEAIRCGLEVRQEDGAAPVGQTEAQETTTEATCPRGETTNMGCVFCYDGVVCSETNEVCPYYNKEEES